MKTYFDGLKNGITLYAWWKDGIQYVGTTGRTLKEALEEVDQAEKLFNLKRKRDLDKILDGLPKREPFQRRSPIENQAA